MQPHGRQGRLAARLSVSPGCGGGGGARAPRGPQALAGQPRGAGAGAAGPAGRGRGGCRSRRPRRRGEAAVQGRPCPPRRGPGAVPPGTERHRVVRGTERWKFPVGIAMAVGKEQSPCFGLGLFSGGVEGRGRRIIRLPRLCSRPAGHVRAAGRAGRRPCRHREGFSAGCTFGFCTVSLRYYFYFLHSGGSPGQNSAWGGCAAAAAVPAWPGPQGPRCPGGSPATGPPRDAKAPRSFLFSNLAACFAVWGWWFCCFFPDGEREGG